MGTHLQITIHSIMPFSYAEVAVNMQGLERAHDNRLFLCIWIGDLYRIPLIVGKGGVRLGFRYQAGLNECKHNFTRYQSSILRRFINNDSPCATAVSIKHSTWIEKNVSIGKASTQKIV